MPDRQVVEQTLSLKATFHTVRRGKQADNKKNAFVTFFG